MFAEEVWAVCWECFYDLHISGAVFLYDGANQAHVDHFAGSAGHKAYVELLDSPVSLHLVYFCCFSIK